MPEPYAAPLYLRCWPVEDGNAGAVSLLKKKSRPRRKPARWAGRSTRIGKRVLVLDCETTTDEFQSLRLGFFRIYAGGLLEWEGVFTAETLPQQDPAAVAVIRRYAEERGLSVLTRAEFIRDVFYLEAWNLGTLIVGFNLPFDLSRLALGAGCGRGKDRDSFSLKLSESLFHGRLRIKPLSPHAATFEFVRGKRSKFGSRRRFAGRFLDMHTLAFALSGQSHSLRSAGNAFGAHLLKAEDQEHGGAVTEEYLNYARQDVAATYSLYLALLRQYCDLPFATDAPETGRKAEDTPVTELYSSASLAKACLRKMGIPDFRKRLETVPPEYLGYAMAAFYGGRIECRIRHLSLPAALLDFSSQYPAVFTLLSLWPQVTARRLEIEEQDGAAVTVLLEEIAGLTTSGCGADLLFSPETWPQLAGFAQVIPDGDFLPARLPWGADPASITVSAAPLTSRAPMWYALPDLAASATLTGRVPKILRAFRCVPKGRLSLSPLTLGETTFDPKRPDFFARVVGERKRLDAAGNHAAAMGAKALANCGCYGIFVEFNSRHLKDKEERCWVTLYSETTERRAFTAKVEVPGTFANPLIGSLVTAGGRLLLALLQREIERRGGAFLWTATDAMAVVTGDGGPVERLPAILSLRDDEIEAIRTRFQSLSPYGAAVPSFLKLEAIGTAYAIGSNRYCLTTGDGRLLAPGEPDDEAGEGDWLRVSLHGMSGIIPPGGQSRAEFGRALWQAVLTDTLPAGWDRELLRRQFPIRRPSTWKQANRLAGGASYDRSIKPFSFLQTVTSHKLINRQGEDGRSYYGPFTRDGKSALKKQFWSPRTGQRVSISPRPFDRAMEAPDPTHIYCGTLADFVEEFRGHPEVKMTPADGSGSFPLTAGLFVPRPIIRHRAYLIGKEVCRLAAGGSSESNDDAEKTPMVNGKRVMSPALIEDIRKIDAQFGIEGASGLGVSKRHWERVRSGGRIPSPSLAKKICELARSSRTSQEETMNERDTAELERFRAEVTAGALPRPAFSTKRGVFTARDWANQHLGEIAYTIRREWKGSTMVHRLCVKEQFAEHRREERLAERKAAAGRQASEAQTQQQDDAAKRLQEAEQTTAGVQILQRYAYKPTASILGVSGAHWGRIRSGASSPGPKLAALIRRLALTLPSIPPIGYEAQCAALTEAAGKAGLPPGQGSNDHA